MNIIEFVSKWLAFEEKQAFKKTDYFESFEYVIDVSCISNFHAKFQQNEYLKKPDKSNCKGRMKTHKSSMNWPINFFCVNVNRIFSRFHEL